MFSINDSELDGVIEEALGLQTGLSAWTIILISVNATTFVILAIVILFCLCKKRNRQIQLAVERTDAEVELEMEEFVPPVTVLSSRDSIQRHILASSPSFVRK